MTADINGLKQINDTFGHSAGDEVIVGAAECLRRCFEDIGDIYRLGGDEFCVITMEAKDLVVKRLAQMDELAAVWKGEFVYGLSISYGIATTQNHPTIDAVLRAADRNMYEYKRNYYKASGIERRHQE